MEKPPVPDGIHIGVGWWADLERRYADPPRSYHHAGHVHEVLEHWRWVDGHGWWSDRAATWVAVLLHDAIYVPGASDNEARSAALVPSWAQQFGVEVDAERAAYLISLTARHGRHKASELDLEAALFLDCDMAILGSDPGRFARYGDEVKAEYASVVPPALYEAGRRQFLEGLLTHPIYLSDAFSARFETRARDNITRALHD